MQPISKSGLHLTLQLQQRIGTPEQLLNLQHRGSPFSPPRHRLRIGTLRPEQHCQRPRLRIKTQQAGTGEQRQQLRQNQRRVVIMNTLLVTLAIARRRDLAQRAHQLLRLKQLLMQQLHAQARLCPLGQRDNLTGEILGAIELRRLGQQAAIPVVAQGIQLVVDQGFKIVGARQVQAQRVTTGQQSQVEFLGVDTEAVTRPQPDDIAAAFEQLTLVAQTAHCLIPRALEPRLDIISLDVVVQRAQPFDQLAQFENQRVGGKKGIQQIRLGQPPRAPWQAVDYPYRSVLQPLGAALALIQQALAMGFEGLEQLFALVEDVTEKRLMPAKLAFQLFKLHQQTRQLLIAALRILRQRQCVGNGLAEQLELGAKLRDLLGRAKRLAPQLGPRLGLVELGVQLGDGLNHAGALGSVINTQ